MIKSILKEIIIILLLCVAILLILSVLFYDYNPINKVVPSKIESYTAPEEVRNELEEETIDDEIGTQNKVYVIDGSDLNLYKKSNSYNPSKENPFATSNEPNTQSGTTNGNVNTNIGQTSNGNDSSETTNNGTQNGNTVGTNNKPTVLK